MGQAETMPLAHSLGHEHVAEHLPDHIVAIMTEGPLGRLVEVGYPAAGVHPDDAVEGALDDGGLASFAQCQRRTRGGQLRGSVFGSGQ